MYETADICLRFNTARQRLLWRILLSPTRVLIFCDGNDGKTILGRYGHSAWGSAIAMMMALDAVGGGSCPKIL